MKYIGTYSNDADIATKAKVDAKQDKVLANGILQGDGAGTISAAETQEVELVELTKADVGLGNVDNTSDANKPISTATQTALNGKQDAITGGASTITSSNLTANRALVSDANGKVAVSAVTSTELGYLDGVTSNIQTQLNDKLSTAPVTSVNSKTGAVELAAVDVGAQPKITANGFLKGDGSGNITADKPALCVEIDEAQDGTITANKTPEEIYAAYSSGYAIYARYANWDYTVFLSLQELYSHSATFFGAVAATDDAILFFAVHGTSNGWNGQTTIVPLTDTVVPTTRTINTKPLSSDITLTAADVNAVGLTGAQTIDGTKTFRGKITIQGKTSFNDVATFIGQPVFIGGMDISGPTHYQENSTVDFTNATITGLPSSLPTVTASDNGKFLRVVNGAWAAATVENANGVSF